LAGFKTHITASTLIGVGYGAAGHFWYDVAPVTSAVALGLCGIAGILPDVDSETGHAGREVMGFAAAVVPLLMMDHLHQFGLSPDGLVLAGGCLYIVIRFGLGEILRRHTVHRGMWHSIPAALIACLVTSLITSCDEPTIRFYKAGAVLVGYLVHLSLDELYSIQWYRGRLRLKRSFGTAMKIWGTDWWANAAAFAKLAALIYMTLQDPNVRNPESSTELPEYQSTEVLESWPNDFDQPLRRR
jgi:hypothetical protein